MRKEVSGRGLVTTTTALPSERAPCDTHTHSQDGLHKECAKRSTAHPAGQARSKREGEGKTTRIADGQVFHERADNLR